MIRWVDVHRSTQPGSTKYCLVGNYANVRTVLDLAFYCLTPARLIEVGVPIFKDVKSTYGREVA